MRWSQDPPSLCLEQEHHRLRKPCPDTAAPLSMPWALGFPSESQKGLDGPPQGPFPAAERGRSPLWGLLLSDGACRLEVPLWPRSSDTVVVKAVGDLVPDHHPDAPEVQGLWLLLAEEWWLEDPGREHCPGWAGARTSRECTSCVPEPLGSCHVSPQPGSWRSRHTLISQTKKLRLKTEGRAGVWRARGPRPGCPRLSMLPSGKGSLLSPPKPSHSDHRQESRFLQVGEMVPSPLPRAGWGCPQEEGWGLLTASPPSVNLPIWFRFGE